MKPKPRQRVKRKVGQAIQDAKQAVRAKQGSRKVKRTMKDSAEKSVKQSRYAKIGEKKDSLKPVTRERIFKRTKNESTANKAKRKDDSYTGLGVGKGTSLKPTMRAKRAGRKVRRMNETQKRIINRKTK